MELFINKSNRLVVIVDIVIFFCRFYSDVSLVVGVLSNLLFIVFVIGVVVIMFILLYEMS